MIEDFEVWMVIYSDVKRNHYKITWRFIEKDSWIRYVMCKQWLPIKKQWNSFNKKFTETELDWNYFKISTRDFS